MEFHGPRTQILEEVAVTEDIAVVYTVPEGKKFFLIESMLITNAGANGIAHAEIRSALNVHIRDINFVHVRANNQGIVFADHFEPGWPVEMSAGEDIAVTSDTASLEAQCDLFGFEVDA